MWKYHSVKTFISLRQWVDYYTTSEDTICSKTSRVDYDTLERWERFIILRYEGWLFSSYINIGAYTVCKGRFIDGSLYKDLLFCGLRVDYYPNT